MLNHQITGYCAQLLGRKCWFSYWWLRRVKDYKKADRIKQISHHHYINRWTSIVGHRSLLWPSASLGSGLLPNQTHSLLTKSYIHLGPSLAPSYQTPCILQHFFLRIVIGILKNCHSLTFLTQVWAIKSLCSRSFSKYQKESSEFAIDSNMSNVSVSVEPAPITKFWSILWPLSSSTSLMSMRIRGYSSMG